MTQPEISGWEFVNDTATFYLRNPHRYCSLYFPLGNEAGIFSAITPTLHGDIKADHNTFLTPPVSVESLHDSRSARNFWILKEGAEPWSATGNSAAQVARHFTDNDEESVLGGGFPLAARDKEKRPDWIAGRGYQFCSRQHRPGGVDEGHSYQLIG